MMVAGLTHAQRSRGPFHGGDPLRTPVRCGRETRRGRGFGGRRSALRPHASRGLSRMRPVDRRPAGLQPGAERAGALRGVEREVQTRPPARRERRIAALLAPGEQQPESVRDVPGRFGIQGDDADLDPVLGGKVIRNVHGPGMRTVGAGIRWSSCRTCPGSWERPVRCHGASTAPRAEDETSPVTGVRSTLGPPHRTPGTLGAAASGCGGAYGWSTEGFTHSGRRAGSSSARVESGPPQWSARRRVGIMSAAVEATSRELCIAAPAPRTRTGPGPCRGEA